MPRPLHDLYHLAPTCQSPLILAPIAGYSNAAMRLMAQEQGAHLTFTEMTSAAGLARDATKTWHLLETLPGEARVVAHLYGTHPDDLAQATRRIDATQRFCGVDLNAGCPVRKITKGGAGAALIKQPQLIYDLLRAMRQATRLPLTIKTRLGPHPELLAIFEILAAAQEAGADALILHARFTSQGHGGHPHLDLLAQVKARATIPIIGNGGITSSATAWQMWRATAVDALMIARAAIGNPWIFAEIEAGGFSDQPPAPDLYHGARPKRDPNTAYRALQKHFTYEMELIRQIKRHHLALSDLDCEKQLVITFRQHLFRYLYGFKGVSHLRSRLSSFTNMQQINAAIMDTLGREFPPPP